jgi:hypothetical protein
MSARKDPSNKQGGIQIQEQAQNGNLNHPPIHRAGARSGHQSRKQQPTATGSTRKSQWQSNPPHRGLELNVDSFDGQGRPDRECDRSRDGVHHEHRGGDADVRFAQLRQQLGERHPNVMVLYAGHPGGFVDLAADLERIPALGRARRVGR